MRSQLLVLAVVVGVALATSYSGYKVFQLTPTPAQLQLLTKFDGAPGYDIWTRTRVANAPVDIMVSPDKLATFATFLTLHSIKNHVLIQDVQTVMDAEQARQNAAPKTVSGKITFDKYYTHSEINAYLAEVAAAYPSLASVVTIGRSTENRNLNVLKISRGGNNPVIWVDAGIHAREWIAPAMSLFIIQQLLEVPANSELTNGVDWLILPVVNPDGYDYTHTSTQNRLWRKTRSTASSTLCPGVDANRNWDFHWDEVGTSSNPCSEIFSGSGPFTEPECTSMRDYVLANQDDIQLYLSFHSYGNYFLYPWGWTDALPSDWQVLDELAQRAHAAQRAAGGPVYQIGSSTNVLYAASGASDDWAKGVADIALTYTIELPGGGPNGFDLPASQILATVTPFFEAVRVFANEIRGAKNQ